MRVMKDVIIPWSIFKYCIRNLHLHLKCTANSKIRVDGSKLEIYTVIALFDGRMLADVRILSLMDIHISALSQNYMLLFDYQY
jgi:hypothetical protein